MRLTLRTMLAYLDDVLEPAETREIGEKIRESPAAAAMVSRIREAIRRRRIGAPELEGPQKGLDPNVVAAYLDNTLPPEQVVELERLCLEDDVQLAEVASCHQILTLVMAEDRAVLPVSLERFYSLGPMPFDDRTPTQGNGHAPAAAGVPVVVPGVNRLPGALKKSPWTQRAAPVFAVGLIAIAAFLLLASDRELFRGLTQSAAPRPLPEPRAPSADDLAGADAAIPPAPTIAESPAVAARETVSAVSALPAGLDPAPLPDAPEPTPPADATVATTTAPSTTPTAPAPPPESAPAAPAPERVRIPIRYVSTEGVLLRFEMGDHHWYVHPRRSDVHAEEMFACPEPFEAVFDFDQGAFRVTLLGESALDILPGTAEARQGIRLNRGRAILQPGIDGGPERLDFTVQVGDKSYTLKFSGPEALCGVEVLLREPAGFERPFQGEGYHAAVFVAAGGVQIATASGETVALAAGQSHVLTPLPWPDSTAQAVPVWLDPQRPKPTETERRFTARFEKEFDPSLAVDLSIPALTRDPHPKIAELAARCLSLMQNYPDLVQALAMSEHEEARAAARQGLRFWLGQAAERGAVLKQELDGRYSPNESQEMYRLLWGFTADDAQDKIASADLVNWLRSNRVEIRELAIQQLEKLTGRRYDYKPLAPTTLAVQRWQGHLDRNGGALVGVEE